MRADSIQLFAVAAFALAALSPAVIQAEGIFSFQRSLAELSAADREAMRRARIEVLGNMRPGAVSAWSDKNTGHSGEVTLHRVYEDKGMTCGEVEYVLKMPEMRRFRGPFCRGSDGTWRIAG